MLGHMLGTYTYNDVNMLKQLLGVEKLDLVMIDSVNEYFDLLSREGIPLARDTQPRDGRPEEPEHAV